MGNFKTGFMIALGVGAALIAVGFVAKLTGL
jgi:hypothetical protein